MWIEDDIQRDSAVLRKIVGNMSRDFVASSSRIPENKEETNTFFKHFYDSIRSTEFEMYKQLAKDAEKDVSKVTETGLAFQLTEIKNSANDLPHPRLLSEIRRHYDSVTRRSSAAADDADDDGPHRFVPYKVYTYIREKSEYCIRFQSRIHGRDISLYFITFPESNISICSARNGTGVNASSYLCATEIAVYQLYAYKVFIWLSMITSIASKACSEQSLDVYFYMTPFKKTRPEPHATGNASPILSAIHVNTGVTRNCETRGEIVVYRAEEWFKVFVHESMHNFDMDFTNLELHEANEQLRKTFCIPHNDILLYESYTETWARIINTMFETYFQDASASASAPRSSAQFIRAVRENLTVNAMFYANQAVKVLDILDLKYADILVGPKGDTMVCRKRYTEKTNVYAYYIIGGILSVYALPFLSWCIKYNRARTNFVYMTPAPRAYISRIRFSREHMFEFIELISGMARDPLFLSMVSYIEKNGAASGSGSASGSAIMKRTMRMTI